MPNYDVNVRRDWFLPLVGGAELNRIKLPNPIIFTSRPYFVDVEDAVTTSHSLKDSFAVDFLDFVTLGSALITEGALRTQFQEYRNWEVENVGTQPASIIAGTLEQAFKSYSNWPREGLQATPMTISAGTMQAVLIRYTRWAIEEVKTTTVSITAGTLA